MPAKRSGNGVGHGGPRRGYSWEPFAPGHTKSLRHGLYADKFQLLEGEQEIAEIADAVRASLPLYASNFEVGVQLLAGRIWRLKRAYRYVAETEEGKRAKSFEEGLNALENTVARMVARLGLDPIAATELGVNVKRLAEVSEGSQAPFDWGALEPEERRQLEVLIAKGRRSGGD